MSFKASSAIIASRSKAGKEIIFAGVSKSKSQLRGSCAHKGKAVSRKTSMYVILCVKSKNSGTKIHHFIQIAALKPHKKQKALKGNTLELFCMDATGC
jgi:hypothetical protein